MNNKLSTPYLLTKLRLFSLSFVLKLGVYVLRLQNEYFYLKNKLNSLYLKSEHFHLYIFQYKHLDEPFKQEYLPILKSEQLKDMFN